MNPSIKDEQQILSDLFREIRACREIRDHYYSLMYYNKGKYHRCYRSGIPTGYEAEIAQYRREYNRLQRRINRLNALYDGESFTGPFWIKALREEIVEV